MDDSDRPSDEAILEQQNAIRAVEADKIPLVSEKEPLTALSAEYASGNQIFITKIQGLSKTYKHLRRTRGDGNCFFRGFLFAYLEALAEGDEAAHTKEVERMKGRVVPKCKEDLIQLGYPELTWDEFAHIFCEQLDNTCLATKEQRTATLARNLRNPEVSNYAVMFLRFVTSCAIQRQQDFFEPFIAGTTGLTVVQFCRAMVEPMGEESDHIHITALTGALGVSARVVYLDRSEGEASTHDFIPEAQSDDPPISQCPPVVLLYRPGHYDILYE